MKVCRSLIEMNLLLKIFRKLQEKAHYQSNLISSSQIILIQRIKNYCGRHLDKNSNEIYYEKKKKTKLINLNFFF